MVQLDLFASTYDQFELKGKLRLIEFFAGIGAQARALENLGVDFISHRVCEWSCKSIRAYRAIHVKEAPSKELLDRVGKLSIEELIDAVRGVSMDYSKPMTDDQLRKKGKEWLQELYVDMLMIGDTCPDISRLNGVDLGIEKEKDRKDTYMMTYSFPCFTADQLVLTKEYGYIKFECLKVGMNVLAKDGKWHEINKFFNQGKKNTFFVEAQGFASIHTTKNHKFWVRKMTRTGHKRNRTFSQPDWVKAENLDKNCYLGIPVIFEEVPFATNNGYFWKLMGAYLGDGWLSKINNDIKISCNKTKLKTIEETLSELKISYTINKSSENCWNVRFSHKKIHDFISKTIGTGAKTKRISSEIIFLPKKELTSFYEGYLGSDGCTIGKRKQFSTSNPNIAYSMSLIINKLFHRVCCVYKVKVKPTKVIEGRTVHQDDWYMLRFKEENNKQDKAFFENGYIWYPFKKSYDGEEEEVYDIEVKDDHSFTLQGCIVSNCQDLSNAGQMKGMEKGSGTRSGLLWEVERILLELRDMECRPDVLLMENVPGVCGSKNLKPWNDWLQSLHKMGYTNYFSVLNAKDYGIPQNRERCFMVSLLGEKSYEFPRKVGLRYRLKDFLDDVIDNKYNLSEKVTSKFMRVYEPKGYSSIDNYNRKIKENPETSNTLTARYQVPNHGERIVEPTICASRGRESANGGNEQRLEINGSGISNALTSEQKDNLLIEPRVKVEGSLGYYGFRRADDIISKEGYSPTILTHGERIGYSINVVERGKKIVVGKVNDSQSGTVLSAEGICQTLMARDYKDPAKIVIEDENAIVVPENTKQGYQLAHEGDGIYTNRVEQKRGTVQRGSIQTIKANNSDIAVVDNGLRIRRLTPFECGKLMGFDRSDFERMYDSGLSESALYHSAGDSIVTTVLMGLFGSLLGVDYARQIEAVADRIAAEKGRE